jgi:predicted nucleic acid-binding protein
MNVVDSSAWLEYFTGGPNSTFFSEAIENTSELLVPTICLYEVFKKIVLERTENDALQAVAAMQQGRVVDIDAPTAFSAARISIDKKLPMADSMILAIARLHKAFLWTQDSHFEKEGDIRYRRPTAG